MKTCPKCGSEKVHEVPAFSLTCQLRCSSRTHFCCDSYGYSDKKEFDLVYRSELCFEREEKNTLQRKVEELQVALDFANEAIDQRERSRTEAETKRDKWRECASRLLHYAECLLARIPDKSEINWTVLEQARSMFKEVSK